MYRTVNRNCRVCPGGTLRVLIRLKTIWVIYLGLDWRFGPQKVKIGDFTWVPYSWFCHQEPFKMQNYVCKMKKNLNKLTNFVNSTTKVTFVHMELSDGVHCHIVKCIDKKSLKIGFSDFKIYNSLIFFCHIHSHE